MFVLGFVFSGNLSHVLLVRKNRPDWQRGQWNGIGGKVGPSGETSYMAISRECQEESGLVIPPEHWTRFAKLRDGDTTVHVFHTIADASQAMTMTDEEIRAVHVPLDYHVFGEMVFGVPWLITMALDSIRRKSFRTFDIIFDPPLDKGT